MNRLFAVIDATSKAQLGILSIHRMPGALPFGGKYRLIDFTLSNMKHAGVKNVAIFPYGNYRSLQDHVGSGKRWDLDRRQDGLFILPPKNIQSATQDMITFQRMHEHKEHFHRSKQPYVVITQANIVWNIDFNEALDHHIESQADITEIVTERARIKTYILSKEKLLEYIINYDTIPYKTIQEVFISAPSISTNTYYHKGYSRYIFDTYNYMKANLDMLRFDRGRQVFLEARPVLSKEKTAPPVRYEASADVHNSLIASGSIINGRVINSVIGRDVLIKKGAIVENSVLMNNAVVEEDAHITYAILDKSTVIRKHTVLEGTLQDPYVTQKYQLVTEQTHIHVLQVASEMTPFIKTGGLADVLGGLTEHLVKLGIKVSVILPLYKQVRKNFEESLKKVFTQEVVYDQETYQITVHSLEYKGATIYFVEHFKYFSRDEIYGYKDDCDRFAFFNKCVVEMLEHLDNFNLMHLHDWHTGLIPLILNEKNIDLKTLLTLHNIDYQGVCNKETLTRLGLTHTIVQDKELNFLKTGILNATKLSTVSETYRDELRYDYYGKNLTESLLRRERDFFGVLNGISNKQSPAQDKVIVSQYSTKHPEGKLENKRYLQQEMGLEKDDNAFLIGSVTRITEQKGFEIIIPALERLFEQHQDVQYILLGQGDANFVNGLRSLESKYPNRIKLNIGYDSANPNHIYAGCDVFLMPSRVEPCGLGQMIAMRYGTVPVVRQTGGLADTVRGYDPVTNRGTGFSFFNYDIDSLEHTLKEAYHVYKTNPTIWKKLIRRDMESDFSLLRQANKMFELYRLTIGN